MKQRTTSLRVKFLFRNLLSRSTGLMKAVASSAKLAEVHISLIRNTQTDAIENPKILMQPIRIFFVCPYVIADLPVQQTGLAFSQRALEIKRKPAFKS